MTEPGESGPIVRRVGISLEGKLGAAIVRERLASRPRDHTLSVAERRNAIDALAQHALSLTVTQSSIGGVAVERHDVDARDVQTTLVYAHGGAFVIGSAATHRSFAASIARSASMPLVAVDYRLAPEYCFPAARDDVVAVYAELANSGSSAIALVGDSAGGALVLQAALAIRDAGLPMPTAIAVTSPWADLRCTNPSLERLCNVDTMLTAAGLQLDAARYLGGRDAADPSASPVHAALHGLPPVFIQVGEDEILFDDAVQLADALARDGVPVELEIWEGMTHAWHVFRDLLPEADAAIARIGAFLATTAVRGRTPAIATGRGS